MSEVRKLLIAGVIAAVFGICVTLLIASIGHAATWATGAAMSDTARGGLAVTSASAGIAAFFCALIAGVAAND